MLYNNCFRIIFISSIILILTILVFCINTISFTTADSCKSNFIKVIAKGRTGSKISPKDSKHSITESTKVHSTEKSINTKQNIDYGKYILDDVPEYSDEFVEAHGTTGGVDEGKSIKDPETREAIKEIDIIHEDLYKGGTEELPKKKGAIKK